MRAQLVTPLVSFILAACAAAGSPSSAYERYNDRVIAGMSFDEEMTYFTTRKRAQVEAQLPRLMDQMDGTRADVIEVYQTMSRELAKCTRITLVDEHIEGNTAFLIYNQTDTCGGGSEIGGQQSVRMIDEDGWKIDEIEITL